MSRSALLFLTLFPLLLHAETVTGRWRSVETTTGGIGAVYEFRADGTVSYTSATLVDMKYRQDGNILTLDDQRVGIGWHPDGGLQINYGENHIEDFTRRGKADAPNSLVGEWRGTRDMGGQSLPMTLQFRPDGHALLYIAIKTSIGRYKASQGGWLMTVPSMGARTITRDSDAESIVIQLTGGDPHKFVRF